jgi:hypothetical protein
MICFKTKELKGSRLRCLIMTSGGKGRVAQNLQELIQHNGVVDSNLDTWAPGGFLEPKEVQLNHSIQFFPDHERDNLRDWWLVEGNRTPEWDLVSTFAPTDDGDGMILAEAKAHHSELSVSDNCGSENDLNLIQIETAILEANASLNRIHPGWNMVRDGHYQLCNRFAWSWKLATMGYHVILVYLGFLHAEEMGDFFHTHDDWHGAVINYSDGLIPVNAWGTKIPVGGGSILPLIVSCDQQSSFNG